MLYIVVCVIISSYVRKVKCKISIDIFRNLFSFSLVLKLLQGFSPSSSVGVFNLKCVQRAASVSKVIIEATKYVVNTPG